MRVKICGITRIEDAVNAAGLGADEIGLNFSPRSKRYLTPDQAEGLVSKMDPSIRRVGVFTDPPFSLVSSLVHRLRIDAIQLHGSETDDTIQEFRNKLGKEIIKAFAIRTWEDVGESLSSAADYILFDTHSTGGAGGTGITFDWSLAERAGLTGKRIYLAGGLRPDNVAEAIRRLRPYAVDVASGVESSPGIKDFELMRAFIGNARSA